MSSPDVIDLRDKSNPPSDDPVKAPFGWRWDARKEEWIVKRSAGGRKPGSAWFGSKEPEPQPDQDFSPFEQQFGDPDPAYTKVAPPRIPKTQPRVSKKTRDDMTAAVAMVGMLVMPPLMSADPYCGQAFLDNLQKITDALIPLLCQSATVVSFFSDAPGSDWMLWFKLAIALSPVAVAVTKHHITKSVEIRQDPETGDLFAAPRDLDDYSTDSVDEDATV